MRKKRFTEEQITMVLRQGEAGTPLEDICRKLGVSEVTYYRWKKKFGSLGVPEIREVTQLRQENQELKQLVVDLSLDKTILHEVLKEDGEAGAAAIGGSLSHSRPSDATNELRPYSNLSPLLTSAPGSPPFHFREAGIDGAAAGRGGLRLATIVASVAAAAPWSNDAEGSGTASSEQQATRLVWEQEISSNRPCPSTISPWKAVWGDDHPLQLKPYSCSPSTPDASTTPPPELDPGWATATTHAVVDPDNTGISTVCITSTLLHIRLAPNAA